MAELSDESLLGICYHGKTHNQNESFNSLIWDHISKMKYVSLTQLELGVYDTVANFNMGKKVSVLIHKKMNLMPRTFTLQVCDTINLKRHIQKWDLRPETVGGTRYLRPGTHLMGGTRDTRPGTLKAGPGTQFIGGTQDPKGGT